MDDDAWLWLNLRVRRFGRRFMFSEPTWVRVKLAEIGSVSDP
jgi:hypothetical protein